MHNGEGPRRNKREKQPQNKPSVGGARNERNRVLAMSITFHTAHTSGEYFVKLTPVQAAKVKLRGSAPGLQCNQLTKPPASAELSQKSTDSLAQASAPEVKRSESLREDRAFKKPPEWEFDYFSTPERPEPWQYSLLLRPKSKLHPPSSFEEAKAWYEHEIAHGDVNDGKAGMGQLLAYGWGVVRDRPTAFRYFQEASELCVHWRACTGLGQCYLYGWGVDADLSQALRWLRAGAGGYYGDPLAQFEIGRMSYYKKGMPLNYDEAFKWLTWSARQGFAPAQYFLGVMYWYGTAPAAELVTEPVSVLVDGPSAEQRAAKRKARPRAAREREEAVRNKMAEVLVTDRRGARVERTMQWLSAAAEQGHSVAAAHLVRFRHDLDDLFGYHYPVHDVTSVQLQNPSVGCPPAAELYPHHYVLPPAVIPSPAATDSTPLPIASDAAMEASSAVKFTLPAIAAAATEKAAEAVTSPSRPYTPKQLHTLAPAPDPTPVTRLSKLKKKITISFEANLS